MDARAAKAINETAIEIYGTDNEEVTLEEQYSGRSMYGNKTAAITCHPSEWTFLAAATAARLNGLEIAGETDDELSISVEEYLEELKSIRQDQMGRSDHIYY